VGEASGVMGRIFSMVVAAWLAVTAWVAFAIDPPGPGRCALALFGCLLLAVAIRRRRQLVVVAA
jgi:hypothetical protein